ncbi:MIZ zinc finger protein [Colletotrichum higginsianum]|nr:MIZ zinc finger protein [Colletotrichum higginsianum]
MSPNEARYNGAGWNVSGAQVAASNETLNFMLGNRRQPTWMTGPQSQASTVPLRNMESIPSSRQGPHAPSRRPPSQPSNRTSTDKTSDVNRPASANVTAAISRVLDGPQDKPVAVPELAQHTLLLLPEPGLASRFFSEYLEQHHIDTEW